MYGLERGIGKKIIQSVKMSPRTWNIGLGLLHVSSAAIILILGLQYLVPTSLPFQRGYDDPTALWCAPPSRSSGNELVYAGSDADVSILRLLQPWETHAHFIDTFAAPSEDMLPARYFEDYIRRRAE